MSHQQLREASYFQLMEVSRKYELPNTYLCILFMAARTNGTTRSDVSKKLDIHDTNAGVSLHRLKQKGLLKAEVSGQYTITKAGRLVLDELTK
jgi:Mn-dependent DtxR family transcriptional regulator